MLQYPLLHATSLFGSTFSDYPIQGQRLFGRQQLSSHASLLKDVWDLDTGSRDRQNIRRLPHQRGVVVSDADVDKCRGACALQPGGICVQDLLAVGAVARPRQCCADWTGLEHSTIQLLCQIKRCLKKVINVRCYYELGSVVAMSGAGGC